MRLTKLGHSCVRLEKDGAVLLIDPGIWSGKDSMAGATAVLITHEHADHLDPAVVQAALEADPGLELWTTGSVAGQFSGFGGRVHAVGDGDSFTAAGFDIGVHGKDHAPVHPDLPVVANVGFTVDGTVFHPGDSFTIPGGRISTLLLPVSAPWLKASEMIDYARAVAPQRCYAIHDELLSANGIGLVGNLAKLIATPEGGSYERLAPGTTVEI
ncbi:MAG TPA: MBL fold metallo-hydrolase [Streptosporangiaceae bacterium]|nr:MBL fold metallo-hydrolase [Streptosporangiaceae bacterium]